MAMKRVVGTVSDSQTLRPPVSPAPIWWICDFVHDLRFNRRQMGQNKVALVETSDLSSLRVQIESRLRVVPWMYFSERVITHIHNALSSLLLQNLMHQKCPSKLRLCTPILQPFSFRCLRFVLPSAPNS